MHKADLRKQLLQKRSTMPDHEWRQGSDALVQAILAWLKGRSFQSYILYRHFRREPDIDALARILPPEATYYPRIGDLGHMNFYASDGTFLPHRFGMLEPPADPDRLLQTFDRSTLLIIPAVAYDQQRFRLGYGGGFFDRFLARNKITTLGVCFDAFLLDEVPTETHDQPVQTVMTESRVIQ